MGLVLQNTQTRSKNFFKEHGKNVMAFVAMLMCMYLLKDVSVDAAGFIDDTATNKAVDALMQILNVVGRLMAVGGAIVSVVGIVSIFNSMQNGQQMSSHVYTLIGGIVLIIVGLSLKPMVNYFMQG